MTEMADLAAGLKDLAGAIRELAVALKADDAQEEEPAYRCEGCGSLLWQPGGMGESFKRCRDCGTIGDPIEPATDDR